MNSADSPKIIDIHLINRTSSYTWRQQCWRSATWEKSYLLFVNKFCASLLATLTCWCKKTGTEPR